MVAAVGNRGTPSGDFFQLLKEAAGLASDARVLDLSAKFELGHGVVFEAKVLADEKTIAKALDQYEQRAFVTKLNDATGPLTGEPGGIECGPKGGAGGGGVDPYPYPPYP